MRRITPYFLLVACVTVGCGGDGQETPAQRSAPGGGSVVAPRTYAQDVEFLKLHVTVIELGGEGAARVAVVPEYQGRVMTSTSDALSGVGNGWINYDAVQSDEFVPHINVFGGEDRFWLGPEGGQFSIFFDQGIETEGDEFVLADWQTPPLIDTEPFDVVSQSDSEAVFCKKATISNYSGTEFTLAIERTVRLLTSDDVEENLGIELPDGVQTVAYETSNELTNAGDVAWDKSTGLLSIWILGMFKHSATTRVVVPFKQGDDLGPIVNDTYFGKVPEDRLVTKDGYLVFRADGQFRSKIGLSPLRAKDVLGSYDPARGLLTIVQYRLPEGVTDYVNSNWNKHQDDPFAGDVVNSYNDGPPEPGKPPLGPFYELETSSPALALGPGESWQHVHRTFHFTGTPAALGQIAADVLGVDIEDVVAALQP
ncbi:MAG: hypothetical protein IH945_14125 [Armatimonadetes bacterium]|nr:hypothetical protein [Armatimonadota bacterium]